MRAIIILFLLSLLGTHGLAQTVSGKVTEENGGPLPGVNIRIDGTSEGTITDADGFFKLEVNPDQTLIFSFVGFETSRVLVGNQTTINVVLTADQTELEEVVVVGYGTVSKSDLTGSVASVQVNENVARQSTTVDQLLQGRAAGVQVTGGGQPGAGVSVRIRGTNSLRGNNEPLYVVDGIIISSAGEDAVSASTDANTTQVNQNGLNGINPRDIESVEILKDASATAIYGSRGANGVVLITTKRGSKGKATINGYVTTSITSVTRTLDVLDPVDYARYQNEGDLVFGQDPQFHIEGGKIYPISYETGNPVISTQPAETVNWQEELLAVANDLNVGLSMSGGSESGSYYLSAGYNDQGGIVEGARFQSGDLRLNILQEINKSLSVDGRISAFYARGTFAQDGDRAGGSNRSFINNMVTFSPIITGEFDDYIEDFGLTSPYSFINDFDDVSEESRITGRLALEYKFPVKGLSFQISANGDLRNKTRERFYGLTTFKGGQVNGELASSNLVSKSYQINNLLKYNKRLNKAHRLNAVLGFTMDGRDVQNSIYEVQNFATTTFTVDQPFYGQVISQPKRILYKPTNILSALGRANYTLLDKYVFTATFRYDGVSKFQGDNKWSFFPSFAFAWRAVEEGFISNLNVFDDLKVRAGWGQIGNHGIDPFMTFANYDGILYATPGNGTSVAFVPINIANENLIWETTEQINVGLDFGVWRNRITGTIDLYAKTTKNLLQELALPPSAGFSTLSSNRGEISNRGIEFSINGVVIDKNDFNLTLGGNIAFNENTIDNLGIPVSDVYINGELQQRSFYLGDNISTGNYFKCPANVFMEGEPVGVFFGYETEGIYQSNDENILDGRQPGDVKFVDQNGDGIIDNLDRTILGDPNPDFVFGINLTMSYKGFSARVLMNGVYGNEIANGNRLQFAYAEGNQGNIIAPAYHNAWRPDRETNDYPRIGYQDERQAIAISDRIIEDGSFMRLSNVTIGYDIPVENIAGIGSLNIYVAGRNLLTFTNYTGFDPEIQSFMYNGNILGVDWVSTPNTRSITLGANISF